MDIIGLIVLVVVIGYVSKSFLEHQKNNPYQADNADYTHPFSANKSANIYEEVLQSEYGLIIALAAKVAKADGKICSLEAEIINSTLDELSGYFSNKTKARKILEEILIEEESNDDNIEQITTEFLKFTKNDSNKRIKVLEFLINLSFIDKVLSRSEEEILKKIAFGLKISVQRFEEILNSFKKYYSKYTKQEIDPYKILGVTKDVTKDELKKVYRKAVKENHPDLIQGKGLGEEYVKKATAKLQEINEAYEILKKELGK